MTPKRNESGNLPHYAWPGGYEFYYLTADGGVLCRGVECANGPEARAADVEYPDDNQWRVVAADVHWEGSPIQCDHCGREIASEYGNPESD